jgi:hypothetical protein
LLANGARVKSSAPGLLAVNAAKDIDLRDVFRVFIEISRWAINEASIQLSMSKLSKLSQSSGGQQLAWLARIGLNRAISSLGLMGSVPIRKVV